MGNFYSRLWHGHAATSMLPKIFVLLPSDLAASGPLLSDIKSADETRYNVPSTFNHTADTENAVDSYSGSGIWHSGGKIGPTDLSLRERTEWVIQLLLLMMSLLPICLTVKTHSRYME
jgi:hypothetical protein